MSDRLRDHSWFIAFAPAEHPRIAVAVIVENGGFGASIAAPIARKVMDTYLLGQRPAQSAVATGHGAADTRPGLRTHHSGQGAAPAAAASPKEDAPATEPED